MNASIEPPQRQALLAAGRSADIFDLGDGTVMRRFRSGRDSEPEAALMRWLAQQDYPVPRVHSAKGPDLVIDRVVGPTMFADMVNHPWRLRHHVDTLTSLQRTLGELRAPEWLAAEPGVPAGDSVLHLDLHPLNVILGQGGPIVIDWTNASRGSAAFDPAMTYILLSTSTVSGVHQRLAQRVVAKAFAARQHRGFSEFVAEAARRRLDDPNLTDEERARVVQQLASG